MVEKQDDSYVVKDKEEIELKILKNELDIARKDNVRIQERLDVISVENREMQERYINAVKELGKQRSYATSQEKEKHYAEGRVIDYVRRIKELHEDVNEKCKYIKASMKSEAEMTKEIKQQKEEIERNRQKLKNMER